MAEYIGDRNSKKTGQGQKSSGRQTEDMTRRFDIAPPEKKASTGTKTQTTSKPGASSTAKSSSAAKPTPTRSSASTKTSPTRSTTTTKATSTKSSSAKSPSSTRSSSAKSTSTRSQSAKPSSASKTSSNAKKQPPTVRKGAVGSAYSDSLSQKRNSREERELHNSDEAKTIHRERRRREYMNNRKLFNFMFYAAIFVAVMVLIVAMSMTVLFGIENINVVAQEDVPYSLSEIASSCDVRVGQNMFTAPVDSAGEQIMTALPYIETCDVTRRFPSTVEISVTAASPIGVLFDKYGNGRVISSGMRVLEMTVSGSDAGVPCIYGVTIDAAEIGETVTSSNDVFLGTAAAMSERFRTAGMAFDSISFTPAGIITAVYDGRINMKFGTSANLDEKLDLAVVLIGEGKITRHEAGDLDLSVNGKATFTPDYVRDAGSKNTE